MAPYHHVTVIRSDGLLEYVEKGKIVKNEPEKQDTKPGSDGKVSYYEKVTPDDVKTVQWNYKLGAGLMDTLLTAAEKASDRFNKEYILKQLPEGYVLWKHRTYTPIVATGEPAAGSERSDTYIYGYPGGKNKRFRSPQDFLPHLVWLSSDSTGDKKNCDCKFCSSQSRGGAAKQDEILVPPTDTITEKLPAKKGPTIGPRDDMTQTYTLTASSSTARQTNRSAEQDFDALPNGTFLYRPGELVWFSKNQTAWGLAVIPKRWETNLVPQYLLQPLSHHLNHPAAQIRDQPAIRPYLAWSVPDTTTASLKSHKYDDINWDRVLAGDYGREGDPEVDASILAAKAIDASYSLFAPIQVLGAMPGETHYKGMFLGAEKVWVGEPVRLKNDGTEPVILIIQRLKERIDPVTSYSTVTLVGDVYIFTEMPTPYTERSQWPTPQLPPRMVADLRFRNEVADNAKTGVWREWSLQETTAQKSIQDVRGRWYETRSLMPILKGTEAFSNDMRRGVAADTGLSLNGRGDSSGDMGQKKNDRIETFGRAVPPGFQISRGLDDPIEGVTINAADGNATHLFAFQVMGQ